MSFRTDTCAGLPWLLGCRNLGHEAADPGCGRCQDPGPAAGVPEGQIFRSPRMNSSTAIRASSSLYCSGGDFMK